MVAAAVTWDAVRYYAERVEQMHSLCVRFPAAPCELTARFSYRAAVRAIEHEPVELDGTRLADGYLIELSLSWSSSGRGLEGTSFTKSRRLLANRDLEIVACTGDGPATAVIR
ncbi:MAG: hypothetical protein IPK07_21475 [Deltaproteobacteria bacterium]|nr:hypothetical protein [Deltaproteobacteria bacterium]